MRYRQTTDGHIVLKARPIIWSVKNDQHINRPTLQFSTPYTSVENEKNIITDHS